MVDLYISTTSEENTEVKTPPPEKSLRQVDFGSATSEIATRDIIVEEDYSSETSGENALNRARLELYKTQFTQRLLQSIQESDFEYGYDSATEAFIRERLSENALATKEWINSLFIEHYHNDEVATGILRAIAHLYYLEIAPQGPTMALAALSHSSLEVRECGVRALENWGTMECLRILKTLRCPEDWMRAYVDQVVNDLEESLRNVPARPQD